MMTSGERIKYFRTHAGLSQRALAELLDTSQNRIHLWETNRFKPSAKYLVRLAKIFQCEIDDLL